MNPIYKKLDVIETDIDDLDKFEFEDHDDLREFFEDSDLSDTKDLSL
jgi:hypothetical protein